MSPGGAGNYYIKLGISINGDAQLQRVLDNIKAPSVPPKAVEKSKTNFVGIIFVSVNL